jgi:hypothetical protein
MKKIGLMFLAFTLVAGIFKRDEFFEWLPFDLTMFSAVFCLIAVLWVLLRINLRLSKSLFIILPFWILSLIALIYNTISSEYASNKIVVFITLTLLCAATPTILIKSENDLIFFLKCKAVFCTIIVLNGISRMIIFSDLKRLTAFGGNSINVGRVTGYLFLIVFILIVIRKIKYIIGVPILLILSLTLIAAGAKGPILFTVVVSAFIFVFSRNKKKLNQLIVFAVAFVIISILVYINLENLPSLSVDRLNNFISGVSDDSTSARIQAYKNALSGILNNPFGIGLGNAATLVNYNLPGKEYMDYPHNIIMEVFLECGWITGIYFIGLLVFCLLIAYKKAVKEIIFVPVLALLLFTVLNSMVSGDLNVNKDMFLYVGLALSYRTQYISQ